MESRESTMQPPSRRDSSASLRGGGGGGGEGATAGAAIRVAVRVRPQNDRERVAGDKIAVGVQEGGTAVEVDTPAGTNE